MAHTNDTTQKVEGLLKRNFFISPTAQIYGGSAGFFDYGPLGCRLRNNILACWRTLFVDDSMHEIASATVLPEPVLRASGHVDRFGDVVVYDLVTNECYRADHLLSEWVDDETRERLPAMTPEDVQRTIDRFNVRSRCGNMLGKAAYFNLMFRTAVGARASGTGYLRPETAQGQFLNFRKAYEMAGERLPFGTFSIGRVFRNEISPRGCLLRVREFEQAEVEYYVHPQEKTHPGYAQVSGTLVTLHFGADMQRTEQMSIGEAVQRGIIGNECVAYFMGITHRFLLMIGIRHFRFRQHRKDEMAHYACDCWDAEMRTSSGYVECVGIADRSDYDLRMHAKHSGTGMHAQRRLAVPVQKTVIEPLHDLKRWGALFRDRLPCLLEKIKELPTDESNLTREIVFDNHTVSIEYRRSVRTVHVETFVPCVIEPSFGIGRILFTLAEQTYWEREGDTERCVLSLPPCVAPYQVCITSLQVGDHQADMRVLHQQLLARGIRAMVNQRNISIGRRYASSDEIGVPYFITFDTESGTDRKATVRERDSMRQVRVRLCRMVSVIDKLVNDGMEIGMVNEE